jgi:hypothetical protein
MHRDDLLAGSKGQRSVPSESPADLASDSSLFPRSERFGHGTLTLHCRDARLSGGLDATCRCPSPNVRST